MEKDTVDSIPVSVGKIKGTRREKRCREQTFCAIMKKMLWQPLVAEMSAGVACMQSGSLLG